MPSKTRKQESASNHPNEAEDKLNPIPAPENGGHPRSPAAHLGGTPHEHTKPAGNFRQGASPGQLREPPQVISRVGKQHR